MNQLHAIRALLPGLSVDQASIHLRALEIFADELALRPTTTKAALKCHILSRTFSLGEVEDHLAAAGLIDRRAPPTGSRVSLITLTAAGWALLGRPPARPKEAPRRCLCCGRTFNSASPGNRICSRCKENEARRIYA